MRAYPDDKPASGKSKNLTKDFVAATFLRLCMHMQSIGKSSPFNLVPIERRVLHRLQIEDDPTTVAIHGDPATNQYNPSGPELDTEHTLYVSSLERFGTCPCRSHQANLCQSAYPYSSG